ncbi:MAG: DEAD/DEAH box helicase [Candidatus Aenigmatarchaeota archaeon]
MKVEDLSKYGIPEHFIKKFREDGILELYPPQEEVVRKKLFQDKNLVISLPTAGGKTFIATLAMINKLSSSKSKIIYTVPLVALANEKFEYFKKLFEGSWKIAISVGDLDSSDPWLADYDVIVCTNEKLDSLIRHGAQWIREIGLIVVDEIHILNDPNRGPTLEILLTQLREITPKAQILALSATINNAKDLAEWLNAYLLESDFRPVKLYEGVYYDSKIFFYDKKGYELSDLEPEAAIAENVLQLKKQVLFFVATRRTAESLAESLAKTTRLYLKREEEKELQSLSEEILNILEIPTQQCKKLAACIKSGVAFHHAGLLGKQKRLIEEKFRERLIKIIVATPTLAFGVNLPAFRVIIRDAKRYYPGLGAVYIPVLEYKQFVGRAGRPTYDDFGESVLIAKTEEDAQDLADHFIMGQPEDIQSKLALEPILRMHILALIASEFCKSEESLKKFFSKTFYAYQFGDTSLLEEKINNILEQLTIWKFIVSKKGKISATRVGKRVSELYIDPLTAHQFIEALSKAVKNRLYPFGLLQLISNTIEMRPLLSVRTGEFSELEDILVKRESELLQEIPDESEIEFDDFLRSLKTALMFEAWIEEATEDQILMRFKVAPGEFYSRREIADWLIYSLQEIALLLGYKEFLRYIRKLRVRLEYGVKEELIPLVRLRQIGRIRARKLFNSRIRNLADLKKVSIEKLSSIVGVKIAKSIKEQLEKKEENKKIERQVTLKRY